MIQYFKNLFKKQPVVQETLNLGKITATVHFKNGDSRDWIFTGQYYSSRPFDGFGERVWLDNYTTAEKQFSDWFAVISERKFVKIDGNIFLPISDIIKITTKKEDNFVETKRGE